MVFESALANTLLATTGIAVLISGLAALTQTEKKWNWRKFAYTVGIATITGLGVIQTQFAGVVTEANLIAVILAVTGASFVGNKLFGLAKKLKKD